MKRYRISVITIVALFAIVAVLPLRGHGHRSVFHLYAGLDTSGSARPFLGGYAILAKCLAESLEADRDSLSLYRVDRDTSEFYDRPYDGDTEALLKTIVTEAKPLPAQSMTLPAKFWRKVADRVALDNIPCAIFLMSDGDNDDMGAASWQSLRADAGRLARCPHVRCVVFCGARKENWGRLKEAFAPLGKRLHFLSPTQIRPDDVAPLLDLARQ